MRVEATTGNFQATDGVYDDGYALLVFLTNVEAQQLVAEYFPDTATTPGVTTCRPIVRSMCAAIKEKTDAAG